MSDVASGKGMSGIGSIVGGAVDMFSSIGNWISQKKNREFQKQENDLTRKREDNAIQRMANDYANAGFNRLQALGGNGASATAVEVGDSPKFDTSVGSDTVKNYLGEQSNAMQIGRYDVQNTVDLAQADLYKVQADIAQKNYDETVYHNRVMEEQNLMALGIKEGSADYMNALNDINARLKNFDYENYMRAQGTSHQQDNSYTTTGSSSTSTTSHSDSFGADAGLKAGGSSKGSGVGAGIGLGVEGGEVNSSTVATGVTSTTRNYGVSNQLTPNQIDYYINLMNDRGYNPSSNEIMAWQKMYDYDMSLQSFFGTRENYIEYRRLKKYAGRLGLHDVSYYGADI